jgi:L-ascorbate metabolism protein UlaG (beta-lactamase superfamily)
MLTAYAGPENGYVLTFTNGLVVYLSGDTGHTGDMATIVNDYYRADLAVMHMGDVFSMGPEEAAFA